MRASVGAWRPGDGPAVLALVERVLREYGLWEEHKRGVGDLRAPQEAYAGGAFLVARVDGRVAGCGGLMKRRGGTGRLQRMYLLREARGQGLGRRMLARLTGEARRRGLRRLVLETSPRFQDAIRLYLAAGFTPCVTDADNCCNIVMFRDLPQRRKR